jgi:hypothetical protein
VWRQGIYGKKHMVAPYSGANNAIDHGGAAAAAHQRVGVVNAVFRFVRTALPAAAWKVLSVERKAWGIAVS